MHTSVHTILEICANHGKHRTATAPFLSNRQERSRLLPAPGERGRKRVDSARVGPTTPTRAGRLTDASASSDRSAQRQNEANRLCSPACLSSRAKCSTGDAAVGHFPLSFTAPSRIPCNHRSIAGKAVPFADRMERDAVATSVDVQILPSIETAVAPRITTLLRRHCLRASRQLSDRLPLATHPPSPDPIHCRGILESTPEGNRRTVKTCPPGS